MDPTGDLPSPRVEVTTPAAHQACQWAALSALGIPNRSRRLILAIGGPEAILKLKGAELVHQVDVLRGSALGPTEDLEALRRAGVEGAEKLIEAGGTVLYGDALGKLVDERGCPLAAFLEGDPSVVLRRPAVAVVGTRQADERARRRAATLGRKLAEGGVLVVSGGANGVDLAAHRGSLAAGGDTVVVHGEPCRPPRHWGTRLPRSRARQLAGPGRLAVMTPFGPRQAAHAGLFARRNRFIAALADVVVVVAGDTTSGARHTAAAATRLRRPVFVIHGEPNDPMAGLARQLLDQGEAEALRDPEQIVEQAFIAELASRRETLPWLKRARKPLRTRQSPASRSAKLSDGPPKARRPLLPDHPLIQVAIAAGGEIDIDGALTELGVTLPELLRMATALEREGHVVLRAGQVRILAPP